MGAEILSGGREKKPVVKSEGQSNNQHRGRNNANRYDNYTKNGKFLGADHNMCGHVFEAKRNQPKQVANFTTVNNLVKA